MDTNTVKAFGGTRYEVLGELGRGAMGVVYKAFDTLMNRAVAIKTIQTANIPPECWDDFQHMFLAEAQAAGQLDHPGIVAAYDYGSSDNEPYIVMPLIEGGSLRELFDTHVQLSPREVIDLGIQVAEALDYAHHHSIKAHCDIKPGNIFVTADGRYKVGDFGIAHSLRASEGDPLDFYSAGTPRYMAPEQITEPQTVDGRADLFSLCVILYEALTGAYPYGEVNLDVDPNADADAVLAAVRAAYHMPVSLRAGMPDLPAGLTNAIDRGLHPDREQRFASCGDFAVELRRVDALLQIRPPRPISLPPATPPPAAPVKRQAPQRPAAAKPAPPRQNKVVTAVILAFLGCLLLFFWIYAPN